MSDENEELKGYFTIKEEKVRELSINTNQAFYIVADMLQENITAYEVKEWDEHPVNALMQYYMNLHNLRVMINEIINNPPKDILKMAKKHNIKGCLVRGDDLLELNKALLESEQAAKFLDTEYSVTFNIH